MAIKIASFTFLFLHYALAQVDQCRIKNDINILSLSAPVTHTLEEFNLLTDEKLIGVSSLHQVEVKGSKLWGGGIFVASAKLQKLESTIIFFDQGRELERNLKRSVKQNSKNLLIEIRTRGLEPFEVHDQVVKELHPFLEDCDELFKSQAQEIKNIKNGIKEIKLFGADHSVIFFLGKISAQGRLPELIISQDGFVKTLQKRAKIKTYPSELSYLAWSQKVLNELEKPLYIGIVDEGEEYQVHRLKPNVYNLSFPGVLAPGIKQIRFLEQLVKSNEVLK